MKRIISVFLVFSLLLFCIPSHATNKVFIGINNAMLPLHDAMPFQSNGEWYVDYLDFTRGDLQINASYNKELGTIVLYNWDITLVFNLTQGTALRGNTEFQKKSFSKNGTIYVPVEFVAEQFGLTYSYIREISTIRLRSTSNMSDKMFTYIAKSRIPELVSAYNASKPQIHPSIPTKPSTPSVPVSPPTVQESDDLVSDERVENHNIHTKTIYITIDMKHSNTFSEILNLLNDYKIPATLFISKAAMLNEDNTLRRICASHHKLGIYANSTKEADIMNEALYMMTKTKSRLLRSDHSILNTESQGYRLWGMNIDARTRTANQTIRLLNTRDRSVLRFDDSEASIARMKRVFSYIQEKKLMTKTLDLTIDPVTP